MRVESFARALATPESRVLKSNTSAYETAKE